MRRTLFAIVATITASLGLASSAQAWNGSITADCTGVTIHTRDFSGTTTVSYSIQNGTGQAQQGSYVVTTRSLDKFIANRIYGTVTIVASASWPNTRGESIRPTTIKVVCAEAPVVTPTPAAPTPTPVAPVPSVPVPTNVPVTAPRPVSGGTGSPERRRFGTTRTKRCVNGRRVHRDSQGRRFTKCRKAPKPRFAGQRGPTPRFTG